jgi:hypothetical protein
MRSVATVTAQRQKDFLDVLRKPINFITLCLLHGPLQAIATTSCKLQKNGLTVEELVVTMQELICTVSSVLLCPTSLGMQSHTGVHMQRCTTALRPLYGSTQN